MPNHIITEVIFSNVDAAKQADILALVRGKDRAIDFETLLPLPLNCWQGNVGTIHRESFPSNALDWARQNWGTKWNAYGIDEGGKYQSIVQTDDTLILTFQTAWSTPRGWLLALWHRAGVPLSYSFLDEGYSDAWRGRFTSYDDDMRGEPWSEARAEDAETRRLHKLMYGVESFAEESV